MAIVPSFHFKSAELKTYNSTYDPFFEDKALQTRGAFLRAFPLSKLQRMTKHQYSIGRELSFCYYVEAKTRPWAGIEGATAFKFGIYFGKTRSDSKKTYRFTEKFGKNATEAFAGVKAALLDLVKKGSVAKPDYEAIDKNPLSQMFKAKILSLYFPKHFLSICGKDHLIQLGAEMGLPPNLHLSEYQHFLVEAKNNNKITREWSNPKFMRFIFDRYFPKETNAGNSIKKPRKKSYRNVNFEEMQKAWKKIGRKAEKYALAWEKKRLQGADLASLLGAIKDRRKRPSYGYDFLSHDAADKERFIEVKSLAKSKKNQRFFLSENEHAVSCSRQHKASYYFYLVSFDGKGNPESLRSILASELYDHCEKLPSAYMLTFEFENMPKKD